MAQENTKALLIAQMKRAIELLETDQDLSANYTQGVYPELANKLHEIRRDSIRYMKEVRPPYSWHK